MKFEKKIESLMENELIPDSENGSDSNANSFPSVTRIESGVAVVENMDEDCPGAETEAMDLVEMVGFTVQH